MKTTRRSSLIIKKSKEPDRWFWWMRAWAHCWCFGICIRALCILHGRPLGGLANHLMALFCSRQAEWWHFAVTCDASSG